MKRRDLELALKALGYRFDRSGGRHDVWTNGKTSVAVPRHKEINELTAKKILKQAKEG